MKYLAEKDFKFFQKFLDKSDSTFIISDSKFKRLLKETKEKKWWRFFKVSKYIEENFENDKSSIIKKYNELGYRDAKISFDTILINNDNTISINVKVDEGEKYFFGNIFGLEIRFTQTMNYQKDFQLSQVIYTTKHFLRRSFLVMQMEMILARYI